MPKVIRKPARNASRRVEQSESNIRTRTRQKPAPGINVKPSNNRKVQKKSAFSFLARTQNEVETDPNRKTPLLSLPKELVQQIATNLSLASAICLTLTCKEAAEAVGTQSWADYKREPRWAAGPSGPYGPSQREALSKLLVRDWGAELDFCAQCNTLHPPLQPPSRHRKTKLTTLCFGQDAMIDYLPQDASHGYSPVFQHIAAAMQASEAFASKTQTSPAIDALAGAFTISKPNLSWTLVSSGRRTAGNLVLKHVHTFQARSPNNTLCAADLLSLPLRLCPHLSTTTELPEPSRYIKGPALNSTLLTSALNAAFPAAQRSTTRTPFKKPTPSEQAQLDAARAGAPISWRCRACPTQFRAVYAPAGLEVTSWHCFGRDLYHASKYWRWFVRREGKLLGPDKRNDEWWSPSRTVPDFVCE
ncbi:hypothetical protein K505DRAFT_260108 [Melanomma pulvis-pyrius CBS 109.77]|uniref:F-box domain-containing protein n=1 Tax=Melanomma pulvis-pyrius CBS 109.77 TaxID=1314802 RepID=A0A6A6WQY2_9PLEO|nr:hypothetical protein K505DRAFT_260108 [Melanomma pulvis-pyrius CBS 109.77]